jgi:hypothetical protein
VSDSKSAPLPTAPTVPENITVSSRSTTSNFIEAPANNPVPFVIASAIADPFVTVKKAGLLKGNFANTLSPESFKNIGLQHL